MEITYSAQKAPFTAHLFLYLKSLALDACFVYAGEICLVCSK